MMVTIDDLLLTIYVQGVSKKNRESENKAENQKKKTNGNILKIIQIFKKEILAKKIR